MPISEFFDFFEKKIIIFSENARFLELQNEYKFELYQVLVTLVGEFSTFYNIQVQFYNFEI